MNQWTPEQVKDVIGFVEHAIIGVLIVAFIGIPLVKAFLGFYDE